TSAQITTDFTAPATTLTSNGLTNESAEPVTAISENVTYYAKDSYTVSGTITEENYDRTKVTITAKNGSTDITGTALTTLQSSLAASLTSDTDKTWSFAGITGTGTYEYSLKIEDKAANSKTYKIKVVYDNTAPESLSITTAATSGVNSISGSSKTFEGSASDSGSGLSSYSYAFTQGDSAPADDSNDWTKVETGNGSWSFTRTVISSTQASPNCLHEGLWTLYVKATDKAGNTTTTPVSRQYWVDQSAPAITDLNNAAINYFNGNLTITGKAIDTNALATSGAVVIKNGTTTLATINSVGTGGTWTANITDTSSITANTAVDLTIQAKDCVGKTSDAATYTVYKDTNPPVIAFTSPDGNLAQDEPLSGTSGIFSGTTTDAASGVASYSYIFSKSSTAPATGWTTVTNAVTSWSIPKTFTAGTGTAANDEGQWYLFVKAEDKAGNETVSASSLSFWYDNSVPEIVSVSMTTAAGSCIPNNNIYYFNGTFDTNTVALKGSITARDSSAVAPIISYKIGTGTEVEITGINASTGTRSGTWSIPSSAFTQDGEYTVKIIATDQCGRKAEQTYNVYRDTSAPTIAITTPNPAAAASTRYYEQETLNVNGSVSDSGSGVNKVYYSTNNGTSWTLLNSYAPGSTTWREYLNLQGEITLSVKAEDYLGYVSSVASVTYTLDAAAPVLTVGTVDSTQGTGYSFTLTGTAYDTNALSYVEIEDKIGTTVQTYSTNDGTLSITNGTIATAKSDATKVTWSKTFSASDETPLAQGQHTFTIKAKDASNRDAVTETRIVLVDTQAPVLAITTPSAAGFTKSAYVTFSGTLTEANFDSLEIKLYKAGVTNAIETTTANPQGTNGSWSYTANLPDEGASYYITAKATDKVENETTQTSAQITTDFTAPATTLTSNGLTNESAEPVTAISENVTYYAKDSYTV
ncbi:MAG: hypothetical protein IKN54_05805, partial [Lachnospiraceae bacterium]|nr:hypothetical protein [Lachnospiraceae bacterium]